MPELISPPELAARLSTEDRFRRLAAEWKEQARYLSNVRQMVMLRPYLSVIGMGLPVVRLLLTELEREPDHWFAALEAITEENPVPDDARGDVRRMAAAWVEWGKRTGLIGNGARPATDPERRLPEADAR